MDRPTSIQVYTYADLRRCHTERLQVEGKGSQQVRNHDSALNQYISALGKSDACECSLDFTERFDANLTLFTETLTRRSISPAVIANRVSLLRSLRLTFNAMLAGTIGAETFAESLCGLLEAHGMTAHALQEKLSLNQNKVKGWTRGRVPDQRSVKQIQRIESFFNLPPGTLLNRIAFKGMSTAAPELESRKRMRALGDDHYMYKTPTDSVRQEWEELVRFRTAPYLVNGMRRNSTWRVKPVESISRRQLMDKWYGQAQKGVCVTAQVAWGSVGRFFGFLLRDTKQGGMGMSEGQLSLALLTDASLLLEYIEFKKARTGMYTEEIYRFFSFVGSFLRKDTGFLWQQPKFGAKMPVPVPEPEWHAWCENNRATLIRVYKDLQFGKHFQKGRDPKEPIAKILAEEHPIHALLEMVAAMEKKFILSQYSNMRVTHKRDVLLVKMLISNPLRVHHFSIMTYRSDNTGNLYQDASGSWRLRFQPVDFKNQRGAADKEYDVMLSPWLYRDISEYVEHYRPYLKHADVSDRVFLPANQQSAKDGKIFLSAGTISVRLIKLTREYIPDCPGFGAHAFRHIVATDYIKNNPNGFQVAANILHDRLTTVMKEYAHVKVADGFSHWTTYLDEQLVATGKVNNE